MRRDGKAYIPGSADGKVPAGLFPVFGFFKTGAEAANVLDASSSSVIPYAFEPETQVQPNAGAELPACLSAFQTSSVGFQTILQSMALAGQTCTCTLRSLRWTLPLS